MVIYLGIVLSLPKSFRELKEKRMERKKESGKAVKVSDFQLFVTALVLVELQWSILPSILVPQTTLFLFRKTEKIEQVSLQRTS